MEPIDIIFEVENLEEELEEISKLCLDLQSKIQQVSSSQHASEEVLVYFRKLLLHINSLEAERHKLSLFMGLNAYCELFNAKGRHLALMPESSDP